MTFQPQWNWQPPAPGETPWRDLPTFGAWLTRQFRVLAAATKGPTCRSVLSPGATAATVYPGQFDLTPITLTANASITLDVASSRAGKLAYLELTQDASGGHTVTWTGALTSPSISTTANKRTLLEAVHNGAGWVLATLASGY